MVPPGEVLSGRYVIDDLLARGGMADVYRGRDVLSNRPVAVKVLRAGAADARRFQAETRLLARLDHPNLVRLRDADQHGQIPFLVMELVDGPTLADRLEHGPLSTAEARRIGADIAQALAHVHAREVIHRDVKPSNILLASDGRALLADFGVARLTDGRRLTGGQATIGTAAYLAPEQISGIGVTPAADVYALGLVLIEALSGQAAFTGTQRELLAARMARSPQIPSHLPAPWPSLLRAMTRSNPGARPSAAEVADRISARLAADPRLDTGEADMVAVMDHQVKPAETEIVPVTDATIARPRHASAEAPPARRWMPWLLGALLVLAVMAAIAVAPIGGGPRGDTPASQERAAIRPTSSTTTSSTSSTSTTTSTTTPVTVPATEASPSSQAQTSPTCAELEARRQAIEAEKQQLEEIYRDDPRTREQLKRQLRDEKQALDAQKRALGC